MNDRPNEKCRLSRNISSRYFAFASVKKEIMKAIKNLITTLGEIARVRCISRRWRESDKLFRSHSLDVSQKYIFFSYFDVAITVRSRINADYKSALFLAEKTFRYTERKKKRETIEINPVRSFDDNRVFISGCIMPIAYRVHIRTVSVYIHFINCCAVERRHYIYSKSIVWISP